MKNIDTKKLSFFLFVCCWCFGEEIGDVNVSNVIIT